MKQLTLQPLPFGREGNQLDPEPEDLPLTILSRLSWKKAGENMRQIIPYYLTGCLLMLAGFCVHAQDSTRVLSPVTITGAGNRNSFTGSIPSQSLDKKTLSRLNAPSVGDAAKYFSGVLVRDYGGAGGLKTVSVRSLGASHTGILYDGIAVSDAQTGQIDLGRYSSGFIQSLDLYQANLPQLPATARSFASSSLISMQTKAYNPAGWNNEWYAGLRQGSFGYWQPFAGISTRLNRKLWMNITTEANRSTGDYPFHISNGALSGKAHRHNSDLRSIQSEANISGMFEDSSILQVKVFSYISDRGLPGSLVLYNPESSQRLRNSDQFVQARYKKIWQNNIALLVSGKYNYSFTRYRDPAFLNNAGGLDNRYNQHEYYGSVAASKTYSRLAFSLASDLAYSRLQANTSNFAFPERYGLWNNAALAYNHGLLQLTGSALLTSVFDHTRNGENARNITKLTPAVSAALRPTTQSPLLFRAFYKQVFRMPTFNDLYYILVGNSSLRPEFARQYNLGFVFSKSPVHGFETISFSADAYYNSIRDKIVAVPGQNLFVWTMLNLGKVRIRGIDVTSEASGRLINGLSWFARLAYTYQQATDITDRNASNYKDRIPYTPDHSGSGLVSLNLRNWGAGYSFLFSGTRYAIGDNNAFNQLDGWGTHDVFISRLFNTSRFRIEAKAELNNISDEQYDVVRSYPMPGRSYKLSLTFLKQ